MKIRLNWLNQKLNTKGKKSHEMSCKIGSILTESNLTLFYLLLLVSSSVPLLQNRLGLGAARGRHSIMTCPPRAAGISFFTGFNLKSGA